jgi:hypothetical protein
MNARVSLDIAGSPAQDDIGDPDAPSMRPASELMDPVRLSLLQNTRISSTRLLMAKAIRGRWNISCLSWKIDDRAVGTALYRIDTGDMKLDFIVHSFEPRKEGRMGRIIGRAWDMMAALVEGPVSAKDIQITGEELPKLYRGRATPGTLVWARSNRSGRTFDETVDALASGLQPDVAKVAESCYLMRNTGLDGNGTFGTRSFRALEATHPLRHTLDAQMLSAYMMRVFSIDLVHHLARCRNPQAATLLPEIQRFLGVGNGSALGLNFYVNNHPMLVDAWLNARETAIVVAKKLDVGAGNSKVKLLLDLITKARIFREQDRMSYERFAASADVAVGLRKVEEIVTQFYETGLVEGRSSRYPLSALANSLENKVHAEAYETYLSLLTYLVPELCDRLAETFSVDENYGTQPEMSLGHLRDLLHAEYPWAFTMDLDSESSNRYVWYKSATAEEPRRGRRDEAGDVFNLGLDLPRLVRDLDRELGGLPPGQSVARFLIAAPQYRFIISRIQSLQGRFYHSPHMNMMGESLVPCDITRFINLSLHGLDKTRDYQQRALRGVIYQGAPTVEDLATGTADTHWFYPKEPSL